MMVIMTVIGPEEKFGPGWEVVLRIVQQAQHLTLDQIKRAATVSLASAAWSAAWGAAKATGRIHQLESAKWAVRDAAWIAWDVAEAGELANASDAASAAMSAAMEAAVAAVVADLVDSGHGVTRDTIAELTSAWQTIIGCA